MRRWRGGAGPALAKQRPFSGSSLQKVAQSGEEWLVGLASGLGLVAVDPQVVQEHGKQRYDEKRGVYVGDKVGLGVRVVGKYGLRAR